MDYLDLKELIAFAGAGILLALVCCFASKAIERNRFQREAIQRGFAHYNPTNAVFEWNAKP